MKSLVGFMLLTSMRGQLLTYNALSSNIGTHSAPFLVETKPFMVSGLIWTTESAA